MEEYDNIKNFLELYENTLKNIYQKGLKDLGKGILYVDINNNNNGNCDTKYISLDMIDGNEDLKNRIIENENIYYCMIDNDNYLFVERNN
jgi:hypothetical protein